MGGTTTPVLWVVTLLAFAISGWRFWLLFRPLLSARPAHRTDRLGERLRGVIGDIGLHRRLLRFTYSGVLHALIFSGFLVLFTAIIEAFGSGLFPGFSLHVIGGDTWIALLQNIFSILIIVGLVMAAYQRFVVKPLRFQGSNQYDATVIYVLVLAIVLTMLLEAAARMAILAEPSPWRPLSSLGMYLLVGLNITGDRAIVAEHVFYWAHIAAILGFLIYIPGSKHRHMFTAAPNIFFRPLTPKGQLPPPQQTEESAPEIVTEYRDFTWKDLLDTLSCTECGRCQSVCPAYAGGKPLSPKKLIMNLRDGMLTDQGLLDSPDHAMPIVGGVIAPETLWSCTTCRACMEVCPVHIEHVPKIVKLRRSMIEQGTIEPLLQSTLTNFQSQGNSFGKPPKQRARWTKDLSYKIKDARKEPVDILWFVGDFASFDERAQKLTVQVGELLALAGVDVGILYDGERNSGNDIRRVGDEGLFELLATHNIEQLRDCQFNRIMTTDPHSLNALKSEYPAFGAKYEVVHYSQLFLELIKEGKLKVEPSAGATVTYHDPCYLGRYNGGFDAPRELIETMGHTLKEMPRNRENSFCCGAGGGRIFMEDNPTGERPSENRIHEALGLGGVSYFVVSCPKDVVMYTAAIQAVGAEDKIAVRDLAELISESVVVPTEVATHDNA
ncbi:4Fe-4S dicluster domain-containing protein [Pseudaminobacter arsenicus]|uniref:4Fe-4S dicluster domain-containing protein n=1 Tax=Borborobacter arsenicus TaxID=1851146 RepID=A0A432VBE7_9HYPH|nr:heterodisulfide reductase-related iron-sulfur binding cluster [Pseudaminobacter arsenicus]RUM99488.1 4Fe-4S dicluster domain-containing protein [Pseudaminobacter arsenicus]